MKITNQGPCWPRLPTIRALVLSLGTMADDEKRGVFAAPPALRSPSLAVPLSAVTCELRHLAPGGRTPSVNNANAKSLVSRFSSKLPLRHFLPIAPPLPFYSELQHHSPLHPQPWLPTSISTSRLSGVSATSSFHELPSPLHRHFRTTNLCAAAAQHHQSS